MPSRNTPPFAFQPNQHVRVRVRRIGHEREPVVIIDDFLANAPGLAGCAAAAAFRNVSGNLYPGLRAPLPSSYMQLLFTCLPPLVLKEFGIQDLDRTRIEGDFSIVTTPPGALAAMQCIPHVDTLDPGQIAALHYLCGPEHGGTAFYRHRRTGFETLDAARGDAYHAALEADVHAFGPPRRAYINGDTAAYERIFAVDAAFNRLILYRSAILHSGSIGEDFRFDSGPRNGRLTANAFLHFRKPRPVGAQETGSSARLSRNA